MNNEAYTAYPAEREIILQEGIQVYVLGLETIIIENDHLTFKAYNKKEISVIHLFQP